MLQLKPEHYTVAWIAPLEIEAQAALHMLDERHRGKFQVSRGDDYVFHAGSMCGHNIVVATLPAGQEYGTGSAAALASQIKKFFPNLWFGLLVGVAAGLPDLSRVPPRDIRLGDVLVGLPDGESAGLIAYDLGKETQDGFKPIRFGQALAMTEPIIRSAIGSIKLEAPNDARIFLPYYDAIRNKEHALGTFSDPGQDRDRLYSAKDDGTDVISERSRRPDSKRTRVWYGPIGSGERLLKHAQRINELSSKYGIIGVEMEAAGTMNRIPVGVIRGVCDYGDKHSRKEWQPYAAAMAAAYAKAVLHEIPPMKKAQVSLTQLSLKSLVPSISHSDGTASTNLSHSHYADPAAQEPRVYRVIHFPINDDFVSRSSISEQIQKLIPSKIEYQSAALWGLGGSGKTQIALDYAYRRCDDPKCSVFWVHADTETSFAQDYKWIARKLGMTDNLEGKELLLAVRDQIETLPQWVFILDNADDLTLFGVGRATNTESTSNLSEYVPRGPVGTVLWTSRDQRIAGTLVGPRRGVNVARMTNEEAELLLEASAVFDNTEIEGESHNMAELFTELGGLALAISQAASFIRRTKLSITQYLKLIQESKKRWEVLRRSEYDRHRRPQASNSVLETWNISMEYLHQENKTAHDILTVLAYVDNQNIPFEMIVKIANANADSDGFLHGSPARYTSDNQEDNGPVHIMEAVSRLQEFSFLTLRKSEEVGQNSVGHAYDMHKLVQEAVSYRLHMRGDGISEAAPARIAFQVINMLFPANSQRGTWGECEKYLAHAQRIGASAEAYDKDIDVLPLLSRVSDFLYDRGRWREIEPVHILLLHIRETRLGDRHPDTMSSKAALSRTYSEQGRYNEAETIYLNLLKLRRDVLGDKHRDTMSSMAHIAGVYYKQGRYDEAEQIDVEVLGLRQGILGEKHPDTIQSMSDLATTYFAQGRYDEDEKITEKVLKLRREVLGEGHLDTIGSMASCASTYQEQGRYNEAEKIRVEVLKLRRAMLGDEHPSTIVSMSNLAQTYYSQGRYEEDEKLAVEVFKLRREVLGDKHPDTIQSMSDLASTYHAQGRYDEDEKLAVEALKLRRDALGDKHPDTIRSMSDLATTYHVQGRYDEDEKLAVEVFKLRREVLGDKHPDTLQSMSDLASTYHARGRYDEAKKIRLEVLELMRSTVGQEHPDTIRIMSDLETYHAQGEYNKAENSSIEALDPQRVASGDKHQNTLQSMEPPTETQDAQKAYYDTEDPGPQDLARMLIAKTKKTKIRSWRWWRS